MDGQVCPNRAENGEMLLLGKDVECFSSVIHRWGENIPRFPSILALFNAQCPETQSVAA